MTRKTGYIRGVFILSDLKSKRHITELAHAHCYME